MRKQLLAAVLLIALGGILLTGCSSEKSSTDAPANNQQYQGRGGCVTGAPPAIVSDTPMAHVDVSMSTQDAA
ncbi:MAG: hypothetical protein WC916_00240 [Candidatus Woesearchaeota archaeon]